MSNPLHTLADYLDNRGIEYTYSMGGGLIFERDDGAKFLVNNAYGDHLSIYRKCRSIKEVIAEIFGDDKPMR